MSQIYKTPQIAALQEFLGELLLKPQKGVIIQDHLSQVAERILYGLNCGGGHLRYLYPLFSNYHPDYLSWMPDRLAKETFSLPDCQMLVAKERGFANWEAILALGPQCYDADFERALDALLNGRKEELSSLLTEKPAEVHKRSLYPHQATLLHYMGSNGVEMWRQQVPLNLAEMIQTLLDTGADLQAKMLVYGGEFTVTELLETSAHPFAAGVAEEALLLLRG